MWVLFLESYLEQAVLVAVLAEPHSTARGDLHLGGVYHPLINPVKQQIRRECLVMITTQTQCCFCPGLAATLIQRS